MIKKLWNWLFTKPIAGPEYIYITAQLNDKLMPMDRGDLYEDPLDAFLKSKFYGEVSGGGTLLEKSNEIKYCDLEISISKEKLTKDAIDEIIDKLEDFGAPKGSKIIIENTKKQIPFGKLEGLAVYLDGINLPDEVYKNSDSEAIALEIIKLTGIKTDIIRHWQGNTETGLYFYGGSFIKMKNAIADLISTNPECENARVVQIA